jgi:hypothetical protein
MEPKDLTLLDLLTHMRRRGRRILWLALGVGFLVYWSDIPHPSPHALGFWDGNPTQPTGLRPGPPGPGG